MSQSDQKSAEEKVDKASRELPYIDEVPQPDFAVVLREYNFPQTGFKYYWQDLGLVTKKGDPMWTLKKRVDVAKDDWESKRVYAAPTCQEFMRFCPMENVVMFVRFGYIMLDLRRCTKTAKDVKQGDKTVTTVAMNLWRIKEADANTAADCYAQGLSFLLMKGDLKFEEKKSEEKKSE